MPESESKTPKRTTSRRYRSIEERRRIVELTLHKGASISEIALAHGIHPTSLSHWRSLYHTGKLVATDSPKKNASAIAPSTTLLPVKLIPERTATAHPLPTAAHSAVCTRQRDIVQVTFPSGATLRVETSVLDDTFIGALLAKMQA